MGNYLLTLRVPPPSPEEDERNHPLYYDWSMPRYCPFRQPLGEEQVGTVKQSSGQLSFDAANNTNHVLDKEQRHPFGALACVESSPATATPPARKTTAKPVLAIVGQTGSIKSVQSRKTLAGQPADAKSLTNKMPSKESFGATGLKGTIGHVATGKAVVSAASATGETKSTKTPTGKSADKSASARSAGQHSAKELASSSKEIERTKKT